MAEGMTDPQLDMHRPSILRQVLGQHGFTLKKQLGQNFLIDKHILDRIVEAAELSAEDGVFEVGPGAGVVTQRLAARAKTVVAVEKDRGLASVLEVVLRPFENTEVVFEDVLKVDLPQLWKKFADCRRVSVVANLPYYVTTPILFQLLESHVPLHHIVVMVQKEVADRLAASPGGKDYGALTVAVQYYAEVDRVVRVPPGAFTPPPNVESTVIRLRMRSNPPVNVADSAALFRVVRTAFAMRRKTLLNNLTHGFGITKAACVALLEDAGIEPSRRGETLSLAEFAEITKVWSREKIL